MTDNETSNKKQPDHYAAVLADLRAKRAALDITIRELEQQSGVAPSASSTPLIESTGSQRLPSDGQAIRPDEFFGMNVLDATEKYLNIMKKPQSLGSISNALSQGGLIHQSKNFPATVFTTLRRAEDRSDRVVRFQKQWALASWYPNRPRPVKEEKPKAKKAKKAAKTPKAAKPNLAVAGTEKAKTASSAPEAAEKIAS